MTEDNDDITITADGATIHASETVSTGDYESATFSQTIEASVEGVDLTDGVPDDLQNKLDAIQRALRNSVIVAGEARKEAEEDDDPRSHEV